MHLVLALLLVVSPATTTSAPRWQWPVDGPRVIANPYVAPLTPYGAGHRGIDIETTSTLIYAPADGVVHFAGVVVDRAVLSVSHPGSVLSSFEPATTALAAGDRVRRGDVIGTLDGSHCPVVNCVHVGVRVGGEYVSPLLFFGGVPRSVLLPTRDSATAASPRQMPRRARGRRAKRRRLARLTWQRA